MGEMMTLWCQARWAEESNVDLGQFMTLLSTPRTFCMSHMCVLSAQSCGLADASCVVVLLS
jgi:hypothetical protein